MKRLPKAMVEAAKLDGADEWQIFWKIYITFYNIFMLYSSVFSSW
mgnify:CR=1 FL=1